MTSPRDALNELRWRRGEAAFQECEVAYVHRGAPDDTAHVRGSDITAVRRSFFDLASGASIPYHRVLHITLHDEQVWVRRGAREQEQEQEQEQESTEPRTEGTDASRDEGEAEEEREVGGGGDRRAEVPGGGPA